MKKIYIIILTIFLIILFGVICIEMGIFNMDGSNGKNEFADPGILNRDTDDWFVLPNVTRVVTENGTFISSNSDSGIYANKPSTSLGWKESRDWSSPFTVEFTILDWNGTPSIRISDNNTTVSKTFSELGIKNGSHVKIISDNNKITYIVDGNTVNSVNATFTDAQIGFRLVDATVVYKNFKIYKS